MVADSTLVSTAPSGVDTEMAFRSHSSYVRALAFEAGMTRDADHLTSLKSVDAAVRRVPALQPHSDKVDYEQVRRSLTAAWSTELLLATTAELMIEDELIRVSNNWAVIQAYYAVYHATQALHVARGCQRPENHPATRNLYRAHWVNRRIDLPPWSLGVANRQVTNLPDGRVADLTVSNLVTVTPATQLSLICKALATTWDHAFEERCAAERKRKLAKRRKEVQAENERRAEKGRDPLSLPGQQRLSKNEKQKLVETTQPATLIDYLYRLRIKANYQDGEMFIVGPTDDFTSRQVLDALRYLIAATLLIHEVNIAQLVDLSRFYDWHVEWLERTSQRESAFGLAGRSFLFEPF